MAKKNKNKKLFLRIFLSVTFFAVVLFLSADLWREIFSPLSLKSSFVAFLDVGQGDAALIRTPNGKNILIDAGPDNIVLEKTGELLPYFDRRLDYVIVSHAHDDHINGFKEIFRRYQVDNFIYQAEGETNSFFNELLLEARKEARLIEVKDNLKIEFLKECSFLIFNPLSLSIPKNGNNSLLAKLDCEGQKFLFAGDNELAVEKALLKSGFNLEGDVLKASHHGSKTSNSEGFLKSVNPNYFVISVGKDNRFKHPAELVLDRVKKANIKIKRTDLEGSVVFSLFVY